MNLLHDLIPEAVVNALGWTLLHSLWQGALLAVLLSMLMLVLHRQTSQIRYRVAGSSLLLLLLAAVVTFWKVYEPEEPSPAAAFQPDSSLSQALLPAAPVAAQEVSWWGSVTGQFQGYFGQHLPLIVTVWLMGLTLMLLRLLGGLAYTRRLRTYHLHPLSLEWEQRVQALSRQLGLQKMVRLAESSLVKVPAVVGHLQPIILLPLGTAAGLSVAQLEAILAHELAHVSRHDYLLNLLQCVVEALFFFHPAVWWISDHIRAEREHCCDDLAITLCGNSLTYAYALTNLEEIIMKKPVATPQLAVAFSGKKRSLLSRIKRLVQAPAVRPSFSEGFVAACVLMAGVLLFSFSAVAHWGNGTHQDPAFGQVAEAAVLPDFSAAEEQGFTQAQHLTQDGKDLIIVRNKKGKIVELYVNGQKIPKGQISEYQAEIDASLNRSKSASTLHDDASVSRAMNTARAALAKVDDENPRGFHFEYSYDDGHGPHVMATPAPPLPPLPVEAIAGIAATAPLAPMPPVPPVPPLAPMSKASSQEKARYKQQMKAYETEKKRYEADMKQYQSDLKKYEKQMEKYGEQIGRYGEAWGERIGRHAEAWGEQVGRHAEAFAEQIAASVEQSVSSDRVERAAELAGRRAQEQASRIQEVEERRAEANEIRARENERRAEENQRRAEENEKRAAENEKRAKKHEAVMSAVRAELAKDGLVAANTKTFSFKLSKDGFYVNDKKQSDALYQKYKKLIAEVNGGEMDITMRKDENTYSISTNE